MLRLRKAELSILFVNDRRMKALNMKYRGVNKATDVLSFPIYTSLKEIPKDNSFLLGDIVINLPKAQRQAADHGFTLNEELGWLLIHGLLHLLGYDHEKSRYQKNKMESKERELLYAITQKSIKPLAKV